MKRNRFSSLIPALILGLAVVSCGKGDKSVTPNENQTGTNNPNVDVNKVDPVRLHALTDVLKKQGLYPELYAISLFKAPPTAKTKNQIFEAWHAERMKHVDARMQKEMVEWKYPDAKYSRQEECGTLRPANAVNDTAENFSYAKDLTAENKAAIKSALITLAGSGIEFAYNGFDFNGCNVDEETRQMDDYVISPMLIDTKAGDLYEFHYLGGCR